MIGIAVDGGRRKSSSSKLSSKHWKKNKKCNNDLATTSSSTTSSTISSAVEKLSQDLHNIHVTNDEPIEGLKPMNLFTSDDSDVNACDLDDDEEKMNEDDFARAEKQGQIPQRDDSDFDDDIDDDLYIEALNSCQKQKCSAIFKTMNEGNCCLATTSFTEQHSQRKRSQQSSSDEGLVLGGVMENREISSGLTEEQMKRIEENRHNALEKRRLSKLIQQQKQSTSLVADTFNPIQSNSSVQSLMTCQTEKPHFSINDSNEFIDNDENDEDILAIDVELLRSCQKQKSVVVKTEVTNADGDTFGQSAEAAKSWGQSSKMISGCSVDDTAIQGETLQPSKAETSHAAKAKVNSTIGQSIVAAKTSGTIDGGGALRLFQVEETEHATKGKTRKETLTQCWRRRPDSPVEKTIKKAKTSNNQCRKDQAGNIVSVEIEKTIYGRHKESITFQRGDVWVWISDDGTRFAYKLGYIHVYDGQVFHAVIDEIWMDLVYTYIGSNPMNTSIKERFGDWVLLEKGKHPHMPPDERIKLNTLSYKLDHTQEPLIIYIEDKTSVSYRLLTPNQTVPQHNSDRPIALDIFAGAGGASIGFELAGWNVKYKAEMNATCVATLRKNFKGKHIYQVDVANLLSELMSGSIDTTEIVCIHGSPPCQGFSFANTSGGINDRQNKNCTLDFLEIVAKIQPPFVSIENVPGLDSKRKLNDLDPENKVYLQTVIAKLLSLGYNVSKTITMASNFGDPQDRKRLVLFASKQGYMLPTLIQTHGGVLPNITVGDVLRDLEDIKPTCDGLITVNGKTVEGHKSKDTEFKNGKTPNDSDSRLKEGNTACTLTKKNKIVHYNHKRYLTLLEYKRLMSFPDDHVICGNANGIRDQIGKEIRDQIGNAIPCRFAEAIGKAVMSSYRIGRTITGNDL